MMVHLDTNWFEQEKSSPLFLLPLIAVQISRGSGTSLHRHTVAQIILALSGKLQVRTSSNTSFTTCSAVMIPPNVNHHIIGSGSLEIMIWFDPATVQARAIRLHSTSTLIPLSRSKIDIPKIKLLRLSSHLNTCNDANELLDNLTRALLPKYKTIKPIDRRIISTLTALRDSNLLSQPHPLSYLARTVNLSTERFRHLFREELGVTLQQYWIGYRLQIAIRRFSSNLSLTEIAHEAGFADLAHFSNAFKAFFGMIPSVAAKDSRSVQVIFCED